MKVDYNREVLDHTAGCRIVTHLRSNYHALSFSLLLSAPVIFSFTLDELLFYEDSLVRQKAYCIVYFNAQITFKKRT